MSNDHPRIQKELLLARMAADRVALRSQAPASNPADFRLSPELKPWALPAVLFGLSLLRLPPFIKAPLRAIAVISLKNRVQAVMQVAQSGAKGTGPGTSNIGVNRKRATTDARDARPIKPVSPSMSPPSTSSSVQASKAVR